jgi:hypothetical protein
VLRNAPRKHLARASDAARRGHLHARVSVIARNLRRPTEARARERASAFIFPAPLFSQGKQPGDVRFDGLGKINSIDSDD